MVTRVCLTRGLNRAALLLLFSAFVLHPAFVRAQVTADSSAFGESVRLNLVPLLRGGIHVASGPFPLVSGSAPAVYAQHATALSAQVSAPLLGQVLQTRLLDVNASSSLTTASQSHADSTVNDLAVRIGPVLPLLTLNAATLRTTATLSGTCGSGLTGVGSTDIVNASVGGGLGLGLTVSSHPAPNTVLLNLAGVKVVLNEQLLGGDGTTTRSLTVNAVHIYLQNSLLTGLGLLSGDVVVAQSKAEAQCLAPQVTADLEITGSGSPDPVFRDAPLTYTLTVTNHGPEDAPGTVLTDPLPDGLSPDSAAPDQGSCTVAQTVTCDLGTLAVGQSVQVSISGTVNASGLLVNTAGVLSTASDPDLSNNTVTIETNVKGATLGVH
jgi:uncharacterized repeat protein (TIGR01451 family)